MCGIAGIVNLGASPPVSRGELERMIHAVSHRGPDGYGFGIYDGGQVGFAHARLSIIDLAGGAQPIANEDESVWVILNGEIFNHVELRAELEARGHRFRTRSDTEVLVHLYEEHGDALVDHLNGQFAFVIWDSRKRRCLLARDRVGIRPLVYAQRGGRLYFASEAKSLFASGGVEARIDVAALGQAFTYWAPLEHRSAFEGVESLRPGCVMIIEDGRTTIRRYWDWSFDDESGWHRDEREVAEELRALLIDAVRLQLRADVPVGAYLSGGLDSSALVALIREQRDTTLRTFSVRFEDPEFDESEHQERLCRHLGTEHSYIKCLKSDIAAKFPQLIWHTEAPILRTAPAPLMMLAGLVRNSGFKVVLTGEGADEVFGGYDLFKEAKIRRFWARQPKSRWRSLILRRLYGYLQHSPVRSPAFAAQFFGQGMEHLHEPFFAHLPRWTTTRRTWRFLSAQARAAQPGAEDFSDYVRTLPNHISKWHPMGRDQYVESHTLLSGYLLSSQGDRVAMANSVEGRVPYLDHRVVEFGARLPPWLKLRGLTEKYILKKAVAPWLPAELVERTKQPYRAPDSLSFFTDGELPDYAQELLSERRLSEAGYFDADAVRGLVAKCAAGRAIGFADNMAFVGVLSTMLLDELYIRQRTHSPVSRDLIAGAVDVG